jgi:hypothetical protein
MGFFLRTKLEILNSIEMQGVRREKLPSNFMDHSTLLYSVMCVLLPHLELESAPLHGLRRAKLHPA